MKFDPKLINKSVGIHLFICLRRVILECVLYIHDFPFSFVHCVLQAACWYTPITLMVISFRFSLLPCPLHIPFSSSTISKPLLVTPRPCLYLWQLLTASPFLLRSHYWLKDSGSNNYPPPNNYLWWFIVKEHHSLIIVNKLSSYEAHKANQKKKQNKKKKKTKKKKKKKKSKTKTKTNKTIKLGVL